MDEDTIVALGEYAEDLMQQASFAVLVQQYELNAFVHFKTTDPTHKSEREHIFAKLTGLTDFLTHLKATVDQKNDIINERNKEPSSDDEDALEQDIGD